METIIAIILLIYVLIFRVAIPLTRRLILYVSFLLRQDEHPLNTEEWLDKSLGFEHPDKTPNASPDLDVVKSPESDSQFVKDFGWMSPFNVGGNSQDRQGRDD